MKKTAEICHGLCDYLKESKMNFINGQVNLHEDVITEHYKKCKDLLMISNPRAKCEEKPIENKAPKAQLTNRIKGDAVSKVIS